jgi:hypothetical protein
MARKCRTFVSHPAYDPKHSALTLPVRFPPRGPARPWLSCSWIWVTAAT